MSNALDEQAALMADYRISIRKFIKDMWGLEPQPVKPEFQKDFDEACRTNHKEWEFAKKRIKAEWFGDPVDSSRRDLEWRWYKFEKGKHFTWQQNIILIGIEKAVAGNAKRLLSIVSGHGIGKSATCTWFVLWFLYCFYEAQVPVTAPTSHQMHDVLWKEMSIWIKRMPEEVGGLYEWTSDYVKMVYSPESWFARARTSTKENTEAIAGVHGEHVAIVVDEASGVPQQVFDTAEGALTSSNVFVLLISNGTQATGYFHASHHAQAHVWQNFEFNGEESPIVDRAFIALKARHGLKSEEYKIRVLGGFPGEAIMDLSGYLQLIPMSRIHIRLTDNETVFLGRRILGIDPSGEGSDKATFVIRDRFKAEKVFERQSTNPRELAEDALTLIDKYKVLPEDVVVDSLGVGSDIGKEIALATAKEKNAYEVYTVLVGNSPEFEQGYNEKFFKRLPDELTNPEENPEKFVDLYLNLRALMFFRAKKWLYTGGHIVDTDIDNSTFAEELVVIRYKRTLQGNRIQLMSKKEMLKLGIKSPNIADAFALTFLRNMDEDTDKQSKEEKEKIEAEENAVEGDDKFSSV